MAFALTLLAVATPAYPSPESWGSSFHFSPRAARSTSSPAQQAGSAVRVTDEMGRAVEMPQAARRIVSLAPNLTETLFALGLGDRVVGDTDFCDYPPEARSKPHVGGPVNPNLEAIAALHPDLVLATRAINRPETVRGIERLRIPVYATDPRSVEQVLTSTARLGELLGAVDQGKAVVADLRRRLGDLAMRLAGLAPANVFFVVWQDPIISVGRNTFLADALLRAGARSVIDAPQDWPSVNLEEVVRVRPDYLIYASDDRGQIAHEIEELHSRPGWRDMDAVRSGRIVVVSEAIDHPSPRLVDAIEQLARALHAERFPASDTSGGKN
jgi:iron complex transport system substrate-binding protein